MFIQEKRRYTHLGIDYRIRHFTVALNAVQRRVERVARVGQREPLEEQIVDHLGDGNRGAGGGCRGVAHDVDSDQLITELNGRHFFFLFI